MPSNPKFNKFRPGGLVDFFVYGRRSKEQAKIPRSLEPQPSESIAQLFGVIKPKFNSATDLLLISYEALDEAMFFDKENWLNSIANNMIILGDDLKNIAIVRAGYGNSLF